ncbi:MAG: hypothetical protein ACXVHC_08005 [Frankiaceae bacterium]
MPPLLGPERIHQPRLRALVAQLLGKAAHLRPAPTTRPRADHPPGRHHRYQVTDTGLHHALFLTRAHQRLLRTGLARLTDPVPSPLNSANRAYQTSTTPPANPA